MKAICQRCGRDVPDWKGKCPHCGATTALKVGDPFVGRMIGGRYKIIERIGAGGMGTVYRAEHTSVGQVVAIKFLSQAFSGNPDVVRRFLNEAKSYARVAHPNAVLLHDFGQTDDGLLYIGMEFVEGVDLKRELESRGHLPVDQVVDVGLQLCEVLAQAHERGVVHRDLKPENIMVSPGVRKRHVKVLDFGIARLVGEDATSQTAAGTITGTPKYMSPEQARGRAIDHRTDIYSLGMILFEMAAGRHPFPSLSVAEMLRFQVHEPIPHLAEAVPERALSPRLDDIIQRATAKDPAHRFQSVKEVADALAAVLPTLSEPITGESARTTPAVTPTDLERTLQRSGDIVGGPRRWFVPAAAAALVLAGATVGYVAMSRSGALSPMPTAAAPAAPPLALRPAPTAAPAPVAAPAAPPVSPSAAEAARSPLAAASRPRPPYRPSPDPRPRPAEVVPVGADVAKIEDEAFLKARSYWKEGRVDIALGLLNDLSGKARNAAEATALAQRITEVKGLLSRAKNAFGDGDYAVAIELYRQVLKVNEAIDEARQGEARCKAGLVPPTLE